MGITAGTYKLGPDNGTLSVRTRKGGAASKAGHNLLIEVTDWNATVQVGADGEPSELELSAHPRSLKVREGSGGMTSLGEDDKAGIGQTIDEEVLKGNAIEFHSTAVGRDAASGLVKVQGELELAGRSRPIAFELNAGSDGELSGTATVKQSDWGIKPYSALFGTLKVLDEVTVEISAQLPQDGS
jgi:polyisoprenoid-binding protein YceI